MEISEETMTDHKTIYAALAAAQQEMGKAIKDTKNDHFRSKYADLASVMDACMGALNKHGICVMQPTGEDEGGRFVRTILAHVSGETVDCRVPLIVQKNDMQGYGSAVTYARRYGLMSMAGIAPEDDDGNAAAKAAPVVGEKPRKGATTPATISGIDYINEADSLDDLKARWNNLPSAVRAEADVIAAKEAAKVRLTSQPAPAADLGGDGIPY
jgi:hypothetical protein